MELYLQIFSVFAKISVISFGGVFGVLPEMERLVVGQYAWLTQEKFIQAYVLGQFLPGPNMAMCPIIGYWVGGWGGFMAAFFGIYTAPTILLASACIWFRKNRKLDWVRRSEIAMRPVVLGLLAASCLRMFWYQSGALAPLTHLPSLVTRFIALVLIGLGILLVAKKKLEPLKVIVGGGVCWLVVYQSLLFFR